MSISSTVHPRSSNARAAWRVMRATSGSTSANPKSGLHAMRRPSMGRSVAATKSGGVERMDMGSRRSNPAIVWRRIAASLTVRAMGPGCPKKLGVGRSGNAVVSGDASEGWFDGVDAAEVGGDSKGTSSVAAGGDWCEVCCDGCCCATAGTAGGAGCVPRGWCR